MENKFLLGPLEQTVMACLWQDKKATVRDIHTCISKDKKIAYTTVMTIMTRLVKKGYLKRTKISKTYIYEVHKTKTQTIKKVIKKIADYLFNSFGEDAIFAFVEELEGRGLSKEKREKLIQKLEHESKN